ncbi:BON domain-containing protein [Aquabacterium sp.]|uniref:BON domain-containing protein n=1 Tax=Aquabacterium sp. TaxID=1872578 RepID=UPI002BC688AD|nr:BON domain-containing protein [Aquabacterium sp.]HSW04604.1 BON domain-containing protein [Aquabacterium sp.]
MKITSHLIASLVTAALAGLALTGCNRTDDGKTAGQQLDTAIAKTENKAAEVKAEAKADINDATITASVNAELAKDASLSALRINVDTNHGNVSLRGTAPDAASKDRATQLASAVQGVSNVDNQLIVRQ